MASLRRKPGKKVWTIRIYDPKLGRQREVSARTEDKEKAAALGSAMELAMKGNVKRDSMIAVLDEVMGYDAPKLRVRLDEMRETYVNLPELDLKYNTLRPRKTMINRFVRWMETTYPTVEFMDQIERFHVVTFCQELREEVNKGKTFNNIRSELQTVFEQLIYLASLKENHWRVVKNVATKDSLHGRAFTAEEEGRLLAAADGKEDWYGVSLVARYTGLRRSDIAYLTWGEVHKDYIRTTPSKTARHRIKVTIPLHPRLQAFFAGYKPKHKELVFPILARRINDTNHASDYTRIIEEAGVEDKNAHITFHCWRHTWRTRLSEANVDTDVVKRLGGWTTDIEQIYNHDFESLVSAIHAMD